MILTDQDKSRPAKISLYYKDQFTFQKIGQFLYNWLPRSIDQLVIICVGSDRSTGDSLGPLTGSLLIKRSNLKAHVYGTLDEPIHALNLQNQLTQIQKNHTNAVIIGIDACLGKVKSIGNINASIGPLRPGLALKKKLPEVGHLHLTAIVNASSTADFLTLQNTRLQIVMKQAEIIANAIAYCEYLLSKHKSK